MRWLARRARHPFAYGRRFGRKAVLITNRVQDAQKGESITYNEQRPSAGNKHENRAMARILWTFEYKTNINQVRLIIKSVQGT